MPKEQSIIVRGKDLLPALLLLQILPLSTAILALYLVPGMKRFLVDLYGVDAELPLLTTVVLHSYWLWLLIPLVLALLSILVCKKADSFTPPILLFADTIVISVLLWIMLLWGFLHPILRV